jgi:hypothetical protein
MAARSSPFHLPRLEALEDRLLLSAADPLDQERPVAVQAFLALDALAPTVPPAGPHVLRLEQAAISLGPFFLAAVQSHGRDADATLLREVNDDPSHEIRERAMRLVLKDSVAGRFPAENSGTGHGPLESSNPGLQSRNSGISPLSGTTVSLLAPATEPAHLFPHSALADQTSEIMPDSASPNVSSPPVSAVAELPAVVEQPPSEAGNEAAAIFKPQAGAPLAGLLPVNLLRLAESVDDFLFQLGRLSGGLEQARDGLALAPWIVITAAVALELALLARRNLPEHHDISDSIALCLGEPT